MFLFYTPDIESAQQLCEEESVHCVKVLRKTRGDEIVTTDGRGLFCYARITNPHPKHCEFEILRRERQQTTHNFHLHIAIAPTKNIERIEWMVEKCTEIGVDEITLLLCRFSERKQVRLDRLEKIMLSAAKQSLRAYFPRLNPLTDYDAFVRKANEQTRFIAHCYDEHKLLLRNQIRPLQSCLVLIGPEGDFSPEEVQLALQSGFTPVSLGNSRLRTETAGVVACHTAILMNENTTE